MNGLITIVMPAYNVGKYIEESINSIIAQSYADWELIVVDDKSTDDTLSLVELIGRKDPRICIIRRESNSGGCRIPRFQGILAASGEFVSPIDADDVVAPDYLLKLIERQKSTSADIVLGRMYLCNASMEPDGRMIPRNGYDMSQVFDGKEACKRTIGGGWQIAMAGMLVRTSLYKQYVSSATLNSYSGSFSDELDHRKLLLTATQVAMVDAAYLYRQHAASIIHDVSSKSYNRLLHCQELMKFVQDEFREDDALQAAQSRDFLVNVYRMQIAYYHNRGKFSNAERYEICGLLRESYLCLKARSGFAVSAKEKLLSSSFFAFRLISFLVSKLT